MPKLLQITELGDPILRAIAKEIPPKEIKSPRIQSLITDMLGTCDMIGAVGLAAPQVGHSIRLIVVASRPSPAYPKAPLVTPMVMINPVLITKLMNDPVDGWEGCASIPGLRGIVPRRRRIKIRYLDQDGREREGWLENFIARIFQHEYDHLNGVVFTDIADPKTFMTDSRYRKMMMDKMLSGSKRRK